MKYIINIDKSSYGNPSEDLRQYEIDIDVLRRKGNVYDSLIIDDTARVIRRIEHKNGEDYILENPIIENLSMIKIELFQGVNYIYVTMDGEILSTSTIVIDYLLKNDFTETYPTVIEMHSAIEQSASNIILQVERKADADKIISLINLSPEEITIDSNRISLQGKEINLTSDNIIIKSNNFSVDKNGVITAKSGLIANWTIGNNIIYSSKTDNDVTYQAELRNYDYTSARSCIVISNTSDGTTTYPFIVKYDGSLIATKASITGSITATSGKIAGYTISGNQLIGSNVGMSGLSGEGYAFWAGSDTPGSAPFRVGHNGALVCSNATITGGTINGTTINLTSNFSSDGTTNPSITLSSTLGSAGYTKMYGNYTVFTHTELIGNSKTYSTIINSDGIIVALDTDGTRTTSSVINHDMIKYGTNLYSPNSSGIYLDQYGNIYTQQTATSGNWRVQNGDNVPLKVNWASNTVDFMDGKAYFDSDGDLNTQIVLPRIDNGWNLGIDSRRYKTLYAGTGGINSKGTITTPYITVNDSETLNGNLYMDTGSIRSKNTYDNGTVTNSPNMYVTSNGWFRRTTNTSSYKVKKDVKRYKKENDINEELNPEKLYDVKVWQFKYRDEYFKNKNDKRYDKDLIGFILEDMARKYPIAVDYDEDENGIPRPESWNSQYLIPAMLYLIQEQHKEIQELKSLMKGE